MESVTLIGIDLGKHNFHVHGQDRQGKALLRKKFSRTLMRVLERLQVHFKYLDEQIADLENELNRQLAEDDLGHRLMTVPGIGPITASVLAAEVGGGKHYRCGRDFAAAVGLVPRQYSTGGRNNLLGISKRGDKGLGRLLVQRARAYVRRLERQRGRLAQWEIFIA